MHATGRIPNRGFFKALIGAVLAALLLAASPAPASTLLAPTLSATTGDGLVRLSWTESAYATTYEWRMSTDGGTTWGDWIDMPEKAARKRWGTVPGLTNGTAYTFQVRAVRKNTAALGTTSTTEYSDPSNAVTATPTA